MKECLLTYLQKLVDSPKVLLGLVALLSLWLCVSIIRRHYQVFKIFQTDSGNIQITKRALLHMIYNICAQMHLCNTPKIKMRLYKGKLQFDIHMKLDSDQRLIELASLLQENINQTLRRNLGLENLGRINVVMTGFNPVRIQDKESQKDSKSSQDNGHNDCGCDYK